MSDDALIEQLARRLWKLWASGAACGCEFDPRHRDGEHESVHYHRQCYQCGETWAGLHCPHDGYQNPCPKCGARPDTIAAERLARECLRQMRWARRCAMAEWASCEGFSEKEAMAGEDGEPTLAPDEWTP